MMRPRRTVRQTSRSRTTDDSTEYLVGPWRGVYWLAIPKDWTYVEIAVGVRRIRNEPGAHGGLDPGGDRPAQAAETARAVLNLDLPSETTMGIVEWITRSPNFYPANSGVPPLPAATVTVPTGAVSGLVQVEEST